MTTTFDLTMDSIRATCRKDHDGPFTAYVAGCYLDTSTDLALMLSQLSEDSEGTGEDAVVYAGLTLVAIVRDGKAMRL